MENKNNLPQIESILKKEKTIALLAPSFVAEFNYPNIVFALKELGFSQVIELTFGAKMINRDYHKILEKKEKLWISTTCPGITSFIQTEYPQLKNSLIPIDSPMVATAKICKRNFPKYKTIFISPCSFKKQEAEISKYVDYVIDYQQLKQLFQKNKISTTKKLKKGKFEIFNCFYNDYTKIYPASGGLSKTAHVKGILKPEEVKIIDGIKDVKTFLDNYLKNPNKTIKFLDVNFCAGGCLGGPFISNKNIKEKKKKLQQYMNYALKAKIPIKNKGFIKKAQGISFTQKI
jgi:iron only hydrogenase large subunit-like protein